MVTENVRVWCEHTVNSAELTRYLPNLGVTNFVRMFTKGTLSACYGPWTPLRGTEVLNLGPRVGFDPAGGRGGRRPSGEISMFAIDPLASANPCP